MPHALRSVQLADEQVAELTMLCGFNNDVAGRNSATSNRISPNTHPNSPCFGGVFEHHLAHPDVWDLLQRYASLAAMTAADQTRLANRLVKRARRMGRRLAGEVRQAFSERSVVVVGTNAASTASPRFAEQLAALRRQRPGIALETEHLVEAHSFSS